ncbi:recombination protein NinG [Paraburkholderia tropica]|uniref:recombination protein NinG n=1 Tax=Paraburkholderia tropica TaxID=92647 RepID=UPI002AB796B8|nr:recombination protein NinG [Paraburkholderia tropica]
MVRTSLPVKKALKARKCRQCKAVFTPARQMQSVCSVPCSIALAAKQKAQKLARANREERKSLVERKAKLKTRSDFIKEAQAVVNKVARLRDQLAGHGCISCGARPQQKFGGTFDAGHYRSVGSAPHLRFFLPQLRGQCVRCNRDLGGRAVDFRKGLIERIGIERVEEIESMQWTAKWDIEYLKRLKKVMQKKARRLEKRIATKLEGV